MRPACWRRHWRTRRLRVPPPPHASGFSLQGHHFEPPRCQASGMLEVMRARLEPLLAELHAHTRWGDGELTTRELVDLYGRQGFDVLCITDHVVRTDHPVVGSDGRVEAVSQRDYPA